MTERLNHYLTRTADDVPDEVAVVLGDDRATYGELDASTDRLAGFLRDLGCERGDRACLFVPKSPAAVMAMIAVLKADGVYVPIDLSNPGPRAEKIVRSADPSVILAAAEAVALLDDLVGRGALSPTVPIVSIDPPIAGDRWESRYTAEDWATRAPEPISTRSSSEDPAHILFTSGSTGSPKGVVITHANVIAFIEWATRYFEMSAKDRVSGHSPFHFDLSTFDIYGTLAVGGQLHLIPSSVSLLPHALVRFIQQAELTQWHSVPSAMTYIAANDALEPGQLPRLRQIRWCGEVLPTPTLRYWMDRVPDARFTNLYGPTETTIASSYFTVPARPADDAQTIPIGRACDGEELLVLDGALQPVPVGETGELCIAGSGLSPGYWRDEEKTEAAFRPYPASSVQGPRIYRTGDLGRLEPDGLFWFLGRRDMQVKSRGHRIELGEIEASLSALPDLKESAVVAVPTTGFGGTVVCCAYVPVDGRSVAPSDVRAALAATLPPYMLPTTWQQLKQLPTNANGKVDRPRLKELFGAIVTEAAADRSRPLPDAIAAESAMDPTPVSGSTDQGAGQWRS